MVWLGKCEIDWLVGELYLRNFIIVSLDIRRTSGKPSFEKGLSPMKKRGLLLIWSAEVKALGISRPRIETGTKNERDYFVAGGFAFGVPHKPTITGLQEPLATAEIQIGRDPPSAAL